MVTFCSLPVALSLALTLRMRLASMVQRHLDLRMPRGAGAGRQVEAAEAPVVRGHLALALQDVDLHLRLAIRRRGERLDLRVGWWCCAR